MKIYPIHTGNFKLDGGAMFGVVPKSLWQKTNPADGNNMCTWAMRCLLVEKNNRLVLIDNGIGNKQSDKFFSHYFLHGSYSLEKSLKEVGYTTDDITDVFLTHLHFDHCGGGIRFNEKNEPEPVFPNAKYWTNKRHWQWATEPNAREKASFLKENILPMQDLGLLHFVDEENFDVFDYIFVDGHTDHQMLPKFEYQGKTIVFIADLLPSVGHIPLPYVMGYDTRPLLTLKEKEAFFNEAAEKGYVLFLEHDAYNVCCTVERGEKRIQLKQKGDFKDFFEV